MDYNYYIHHSLVIHLKIEYLSTLNHSGGNMRLIAMHQKSKYAHYIEGFYKYYECIILWNDSSGLEISSNPFFSYSSENKVPKYTNPFS